MIDNDTANSYQVNQDDKEFIITTEVLNDNLKVECKDNNEPDIAVFSQMYSLKNFKEMDLFFQPYDDIMQVCEELNKAIEQQAVSINNNNDNTLSINFLLRNEMNTGNIMLQLQRESFDSQTPKKSKIEGQNYEFQGRCSCPLDNERIDKLEVDSGKLQTDHEFLRNEINQLIEKINGLNSRISKLKEDNIELNQKTLALREENNNRRVEAIKLRENNEVIKRQNQQLREKKNRLEFLLKEHHDPDENQFLNKTSQSPFQTKASKNDNNNTQPSLPRTGAGSNMSAISPIGAGGNNRNRPTTNSSSGRPIIVNNNSFDNNPTNTDFTFSRGTIIRDKSELEMIVSKINKYNRGIKIDLIYKASVDSDKADAFHQNCDNSSSTIVLIETVNGRRFGGYTSQSWEGDCVDKRDPNAFIFSLDKMETYDVIQGKEAIGCYPDFGPVFLGCQIRVYDDAFSKGGSTFERGVTYLTNEDYELTGGEKLFGIKEIEVYDIRFE